MLHVRSQWMLALAVVSACSSLRLNLVKQSTRQPSNVAVYFHVRTNKGDPVPGLTADRFRILEDGAPVSATEAKQTILNREVAAIHYTLLLLDMSGSVTQSGELPALQAAAQQFATRVSKLQKVGVYAFDGSPHIIPIAPFDSTDDPTLAIATLSTAKVTDPSTNLNGAVVEAIRTLQQSLALTSQPLKFGTLVVFTDGTDRAARVTHNSMMSVVDSTEYDIFTVGVGNEINRSELGDLGRSGTVFEPNPAAIGPAFDRVARRVEESTRSYYLLSYCSPARAGSHELRIEAVALDGTKGSLDDIRFNATGFTPGCDPAADPFPAPPPAVGQPATTAPPPTAKTITLKKARKPKPVETAAPTQCKQGTDDPLCRPQAQCKSNDLQCHMGEPMP